MKLFLIEFLPGAFQLFEQKTLISFNDVFFHLGVSLFYCGGCLPIRCKTGAEFFLHLWPNAGKKQVLIE